MSALNFTLSQNETWALHNITQFFQVQPENGQCYTPSSLMLWFVSLIVLSGTWTIIFGSQDFRRLLGRSSLLPPFKNKGLNHFYASWGSIIWNVVATVITAYYLSKSDGKNNLPHPPYRYILMSWWARPLPGALTVIMSYFDIRAYHSNFIEIIFVESVYSLIPIWLFGDEAVSTALFLTKGKRYVAADPDYLVGFRMVRGGAAVGITAWILIFFLLAKSSPNKKSAVNTWSEDKDSSIGLRLWAWSLCFFRCVSGGLMWAGSLKLSPGIFCPTELMIKRVTLIWTIVPLLDILWRSAFRAEKKVAKPVKPGP